KWRPQRPQFPADDPLEDQRCLAVVSISTSPRPMLLELTNLDRLAAHFSLDCLLEGQKGNVHRVFQFQSLCVPLLEERLRRRRTLANGSRLPREIAARRVNLVQHGPALQNTAGLATGLLLLAFGSLLLLILRLSSLLHDLGNILNQYPCRGVLVVDALVASVRHFACLVDEDSVIGAHA
ncbi:hypothetical protein BN1708_015376, partial [Verticillium longisporum]